MSAPAGGNDLYLQLPPLTDLMYHACRGNEYEFSAGGPESITGYLDDGMLDEIWEQINTALRCAQVPASGRASTATASPLEPFDHAHPDSWKYEAKGHLTERSALQPEAPCEDTEIECPRCSEVFYLTESNSTAVRRPVIGGRE